MRWTGPAESLALLSAVHVPARAAASTRGVLPWAPLVGLLLGGAATGIGWLGARWVSPLVGGVLALAALAVLTRGLHLDGLADTADGLGPLRDRVRARQVMHAGDIGPFGVATVVLTLLLQAACLGVLLPRWWPACWLAVVVARVAMARAGLPAVAIAEGSALGRAVAGTVSRAWLAGCWLVAAALAVGGGWLVGGAPAAWRLVGAGVAGLLGAELVRMRATARLGGITGDVIGAMGEVTTAVSLLLAAALLR